MSRCKARTRQAAVLKGEARKETSLGFRSGDFEILCALWMIALNVVPICGVRCCLMQERTYAYGYLQLQYSYENGSRMNS
eukprot:scaffold118807_cov36-Prasinocladus_malaysianus.AAC.2